MTPKTNREEKNDLEKDKDGQSGNENKNKYKDTVQSSDYNKQKKNRKKYSNFYRTIGMNE